MFVCQYSWILKPARIRNLLCSYKKASFQDPEFLQIQGPENHRVFWQFSLPENVHSGLRIHSTLCDSWLSYSAVNVAKLMPTILNMELHSFLNHLKINSQKFGFPFDRSKQNSFSSKHDELN